MINSVKVREIKLSKFFQLIFTVKGRAASITAATTATAAEAAAAATTASRPRPGTRRKSSRG